MQPLPPPQGLVTEASPGPSVRTELGHDIVINSFSSLNRISVVVNDQAAPALIRPGATIGTRFLRDGSARPYRFIAQATIAPSELVAAVELRFMLLDVFGGHMKTLAVTQVRDIHPEKPFILAGVDIQATTTMESASWRAWEHEVEKYGTSIAWIAKVRRADGTIWQIDEAHLLEEIVKVRRGITREHLAPNTEDPDLGGPP